MPMIEEQLRLTHWPLRGVADDPCDAAIHEGGIIPAMRYGEGLGQF